MNAVALAWAFLCRRWGQALPAVVAGALSIAMVQMVMIAERELPRAATQAFGGVDVVVGPKGSALDLVMCCVLHVSDPRGLVPLAAAEQALASPMVKAKAPMALGDNFNNIRIVGTTPDFLTVYGAHLAAGQMWTGASQAVLGAQAAYQSGLRLGDRFVGSHGLVAGGEEHGEFPYTVTGILAPTGAGLDRLILTDIATVWTIHQHHEADEAQEHGQKPPPPMPPTATVMVAAVKSPVALAMLPRQIDADPHFSAAVPAFESARLIRAARPVALAVLGIGLLFALVAALTAAAVLTATMAARTRDLALLRVLGAHGWELAVIAVVEALLLAVLSVLLGLGSVWLAGPAVARILAEKDGLLVALIPTGSDILILTVGAVAASCLAAAIPAFRATRAPMETVLSP